MPYISAAFSNSTLIEQISALVIKIMSERERHLKDVVIIVYWQNIKDIDSLQSNNENISYSYTTHERGLHVYSCGLFRMTRFPYCQT